MAVPDWLANLRDMLLEELAFYDSGKRDKFEQDFNDLDAGNKDLSTVRNQFALHGLRILSKGKTHQSVKAVIDAIELLHERARDNGEDSVSEQEWLDAKAMARNAKRLANEDSKEVLLAAASSADVRNPRYIANMIHSIAHSAEDNEKLSDEKKIQELRKVYEDHTKELLKIIRKIKKR